MGKHDEGNRQVDHEGSGAAGGKEALRPDQQAAPGIEPDSAMDEQLRRSKQRTPGGLEPNSIVRN